MGGRVWGELPRAAPDVAARAHGKLLLQHRALACAGRKRVRVRPARYATARAGGSTAPWAESAERFSLSLFRAARCGADSGLFGGEEKHAYRV